MYLRLQYILKRSFLYKKNMYTILYEYYLYKNDRLVLSNEFQRHNYPIQSAQTQIIFIKKHEETL